MDAKLLSKIALRVLALFFIVEGINNLPSITGLTIQSFDDGTIMHGLLLEYVMVFIPIAMGLVVWWFASKISTWIVGKGGSAEPHAPLDAISLQTIAFVTIGVFLVIECLPNIIAIIYVSMPGRRPESFPPLSSNTLFFTLIAKTVLGLVLVLGARFFTQILRRFREFGLAPGSRE